jgi:hypothetical protein
MKMMHYMTVLSIRICRRATSALGQSRRSNRQPANSGLPRTTGIWAMQPTLRDDKLLQTDSPDGQHLFNFSDGRFGHRAFRCQIACA